MTHKKVPLPIELPGLEEGLRKEIEARVDEFEREHLDSAMAGGDGYVAKIKMRDYAIAITLNVIVIIWLIIALA